MREESLLKYLNWEMIETEESWSNYEREKIESLLQLEEEIFEFLVEDVAHFIF